MSKQNTGLSVPSKYVFIDPCRHQLFGRSARYFRCEANTPTQCALIPINCLASEVQDVEIFYDNVTDKICKGIIY